MAEKEVKDLNGALKPETMEILQQQVDESIKSAEQMNRVEINFFGELLESLKEMKKSLQQLNRAFVLANTEPLLKAMAGVGGDEKPPEEKKV